MRNIEMLGKLLDVGNLRQKVIAHNIANVNTPGFRKSEVEFESTFQAELARRGVGAAGKVDASVVSSTDKAVRSDGNNVDIDRELGLLSKNALLYKTYATILSKKFGMMGAAITGQSR